MDLLYESGQKFSSDMDDDMNDFLDNDVFQSHATTVSGSYTDDDWFNSFFEDPVLNDKMITDAAQPPRINCEHSYSSVNDSLSGSELGDMVKMEDLESDLLINNHAIDLSNKAPTTLTVPKTEPLEKDPILLTSTASPTVLTRTFTVTKQQPTIILASSQGQTTLSERSVLPKITVKSEPPDMCDVLDQKVNIDSLVLPPTPPSSNNSDSDSCPSPNRSAPSSPVRQLPYSRQIDRSSSSLSSSCSLSPTGSSKHYSLYSSSQNDCMDIVFQQIPTSGILVLSEEEKRTLISEGYPIPSKLPLTKQEEKNLKKIRRKIKNKISAQESRRKKKEYLEALEKRVESFSHENSELKKKVDSLENNNRSLLSQLQKLQSLVGKIRPSGGVPQTGLMVLVLCFAVFMGSWTPSSLNIGYSTSKPGLPASNPFTNPQLVKPSPLMGPHIGRAKVDSYCTPPTKSRVLMSLRGEQDDLNWYDIYGPNIPVQEKPESSELRTQDAGQNEYQPKVSSAETIKTDAAAMPEDSKQTSDQDVVVMDASIPVKTVSSVVEVTVDGRFGHANHSRDDRSKPLANNDLTRAEMKADGILESADTI